MPFTGLDKARKSLVVSGQRAQVFEIKNGPAKKKYYRLTRPVNHITLDRIQPSEIRTYYYSKIANALMPGIAIKYVQAVESRPKEGIKGHLVSERIKLDRL